MNCSQLAYDITGLPQIGLENPTDWGKQGLRLVANGCEAGNFSDSNNAEFKYSTVNSIEYAIPSPTFSSPTSAANGLNTSSLFVYMLIALLLMNLTRKLSN
ncbi:hypothetical protein INT47_002347 [Mucor saturninus]|uniref:Uncharacterized protein n=1 Tax=Mucor saturninus TaxID=64648 RepID=A0A8H7UWH8_9FUNG|nr:hypothetical protein INT47_002347 [Mucor saturninus]